MQAFAIYGTPGNYGGLGGIGCEVGAADGFPGDSLTA